MKKILGSKIKYLILALFAILAVAGLVINFMVEINHDLTKYLPEDSNTKQALEILGEEFGNYAAVELMVKDVEKQDAIEIKNALKEVEYIKSVIWLDDLEKYATLITDPTILAQLQVVLEGFYKDNNALFQIVMEYDAYDLLTEEAIDNIKNLSILKDREFHLRGEALYNIDTRRIADGEVFKILVVIVPIIIVILLLAAKSWIEPVLILINLAVAIAINLGTNFILGEISFITQTMAMALQLAISLDYSLFLIHRYYEEKQNGNGAVEATAKALKTTFGSILGSAMTTVVGFAALLFMNYTIGADIGLVMGKGILLSFFTSIVLLPILIVIFSKVLDKSMKKRTRSANIAKVAKVFYKRKWVTLILFFGLTVIGIVFQNSIKFKYGNTEISDAKSSVVKDEAAINQVFGVNKPVLILVPNGDLENELENEGKLSQELLANDNIIAINSISLYETMLGIPRTYLPPDIKSQFIGDNYTRIIINIKIENESQEMYDFSDELNEIVAKYYEDYYLAGVATSTSEIKNVVTKDAIIVTLVSIIGVGLVILLIFKSFSLPVLLLIIIQASIWINTSILFVADMRVVYIGYLVIQTLQLGATIDYAVLLTSRYKEFRTENNSKEAIKKALNSSGISVIISAAVLAIAGYAEGLFSNISAVKEIGLLIGNGAVISCLLVIFVLPSALIAFDKIISKTTLKANFLTKPIKENNEITEVIEANEVIEVKEVKEEPNKNKKEKSRNEIKKSKSI